MTRLPKRLDLENTIKFVNKIYNLSEAKHYVMDFSLVEWFEPFSLLYLGYELKQHRELKPETKFSAINFNKGEANSYAAHMGFFRSFGLQYGKKPGEVSGNSVYLPIRILNVETLRRRALDEGVPIGQYVEKYARRMACVLVQQDSGNLLDTLEYCFREMLRNVAEHSDAKQLAYCGQFWPNKNKVEIAILDSGIGIHESIKKNPYLQLKTSKVALYASLLPGISGKMYEGKKRKANDIWENSGYGLYLTSELCRNGGSFFICSDSAGVVLQKNNKKDLITNMHGTALRLVFDTRNVIGVEKALSSYRQKGQQKAKELKGAVLTASIASSMLLNK